MVNFGIMKVEVKRKCEGEIMEIKLLENRIDNALNAFGMVSLF